ncbi:helix-turn-helix domain-containing protein [Microbacterium karelineae]|uniref:helix-turn-helix domain-containing protein n=1 Tax=Microbacterium karelineae TaxID=2654283 RepID=UPI0018D41DAF|nr:helix-turn-helix domain-containing protein [Microbacterium karelineae]
MTTPTDPQDRRGSAPDSVALFAADLRDLRSRADNPTLERLAHRTHVSKSVLSDAFRGSRLPTATTVAQLARALRTDPAPWLERRERLVSAPPHTIPARRRPLRARRRRLAYAVAAGAALLTIIGTGVWTAQGTTPRDGRDLRTLPTLVAAIGGADADRTTCAEDAVVVASELRLNRSVRIELLRSESCRSAWGRATHLLPVSGAELDLRIHPADAPYGGHAEHASGTDGDVTTPMIARDVDRVCGVAAVTLPGEARRELGPPVCG